MKTFYLLLLVGLVILPAGLFGADDTVILDLAATPPGTYYYTIIKSPNGVVTVNQVQKVIQIGAGAPAPFPSPFVPPVVNPTPFPPQPTPVPTPPVVNPTPVPVPPVPSDQVETLVQDLTQQALRSGGSVTTAVSLQRAYNLVASSVEAGQIPKEKVFEALRVASDIVVSQQNETAKWETWRNSVSRVFADFQAQGALNTLDQVVGMLRRIESGIKNAVNTMGVKDPTLMDKIDYDTILKVQRSIIDNLSKLKG